MSEDVRESNERIAKKARALRFVARVPFICECTDPDCREFMALQPEEYLERGAEGYVTLDGHHRRKDQGPSRSGTHG